MMPSKKPAGRPVGSMFRKVAVPPRASSRLRQVMRDAETEARIVQLQAMEDSVKELCYLRALRRGLLDLAASLEVEEIDHG